MRISFAGEGVPSGAFGGHDRRRPPAQVHLNVRCLPRDLLSLRLRRLVARLADRRSAALGGERRTTLLLLDHEGLLRKASRTPAPAVYFILFCHLFGCFLLYSTSPHASKNREFDLISFSHTLIVL